MEIFSEVYCILIKSLLFLGIPKVKKPIDFTKKLPTDGRPLYLDAQATTQMVSLIRM
jgi:hypothetical protein